MKSSSSCLWADEAPDPLDAAKRRLFAADLLDRDLAGGEPGENRVERKRAVDLPAEGNIFAGAFAHDQAAGVRVGPKARSDANSSASAMPMPSAAKSFHSARRGNSTSTYPSQTAP